MRTSADSPTRWLLLAVPVVIALCHRFVFPIPESYQWIFFCATIFFTGIPHGSLDHLVARYNSSLQLKRFSSWRFYVTYLSRMALFAVCWYYFPFLSLLIFILISAFHFGETDLAVDQPADTPVIMLQTSYGLFLILALLLTHREDSAAILRFLDKNNALQFSELIMDTVATTRIMAFSVVLLLLCTAWFHFTHGPAMKWYRTILVQTFLLIFTLNFLPFPLAFAFYFGCWHSIQSLQSIREYLAMASRRNISWSWMVIKVIPFTLLAFVGLAMLAFIVSYTRDIHTYTMLMFIGIAILTAPHLEVMSKMYAHLRK